MPLQAEYNGFKYEFPDGTSEADIAKAVQQHQQQNVQPSHQTQDFLTPEQRAAGGQAAPQEDGSIWGATKAGWKAMGANVLAATIQDDSSDLSRYQLAKAKNANAVAAAEQEKLGTVGQVASGVLTYAPVIAAGIVQPELGAAAMGTLATADALRAQAEEGNRYDIGKAGLAGVGSAAVDYATGGLARGARAAAMAANPLTRAAARAGEAVVQPAVSNMSMTAMSNLAAGKPWNEGLAEAGTVGAVAGGILHTGAHGLSRALGGNISPEGRTAIQTDTKLKNKGVEPPAHFTQQAFDTEDALGKIKTSMMNSTLDDDVSAMADAYVNHSASQGSASAAQKMAELAIDTDTPMTMNMLDQDIGAGVENVSGQTTNLARDLYGKSGTQLYKQGASVTHAKGSMIPGVTAKANEAGTTTEGFKAQAHKAVVDAYKKVQLGVFDFNYNKILNMSKELEQGADPAHAKQYRNLANDLKLYRDVGSSVGSGQGFDSSVLKDISQRIVKNASDLGVWDDLKGINGKEGSFNPIIDMQAYDMYHTGVRKIDPSVRHSLANEFKAGEGIGAGEIATRAALGAATIASPIHGAIGIAGKELMSKLSRSKLARAKAEAREAVSALARRPEARVDEALHTSQPEAAAKASQEVLQQEGYNAPDLLATARGEPQGAPEAEIRTTVTPESQAQAESTSTAGTTTVNGEPVTTAAPQAEPAVARSEPVQPTRPRPRQYAQSEAMASHAKENAEAPQAEAFVSPTEQYNNPATPWHHEQLHQIGDSEAGRPDMTVGEAEGRLAQYRAQKARQENAAGMAQQPGPRVEPEGAAPDVSPEAVQAAQAAATERAAGYVPPRESEAVRASQEAQQAAPQEPIPEATEARQLTPEELEAARRAATENAARNIRPQESEAVRQSQTPPEPEAQPAPEITPEQIEAERARRTAEAAKNVPPKESEAVKAGREETAPEGEAKAEEAQAAEPKETDVREGESSEERTKRVAEMAKRPAEKRLEKAKGKRADLAPSEITRVGRDKKLIADTNREVETIAARRGMDEGDIWAVIHENGGIDKLTEGKSVGHTLGTWLAADKIKRAHEADNIVKQADESADEIINDVAGGKTHEEILDTLKKKFKSLGVTDEVVAEAEKRAKTLSGGSDEFDLSHFANYVKTVGKEEAARLREEAKNTPKTKQPKEVTIVSNKPKRPMSESIDFLRAYAQKLDLHEDPNVVGDLADPKNNSIIAKATRGTSGEDTALSVAAERSVMNKMHDYINAKVKDYTAAINAERNKGLKMDKKKLAKWNRLLDKYRKAEGDVETADAYFEDRIAKREKEDRKLADKYDKQVQAAKEKEDAQTKKLKELDEAVSDIQKSVETMREDITNQVKEHFGAAMEKMDGAQVEENIRHVEIPLDIDSTSDPRFIKWSAMMETAADALQTKGRQRQADAVRQSHEIILKGIERKGLGLGKDYLMSAEDAHKINTLVNKEGKNAGQNSFYGLLYKRARLAVLGDTESYRNVRYTEKRINKMAERQRAKLEGNPGEGGVGAFDIKD